MEPDQLEAIKAEIGAQGDVIIARIKESEDKVRALDEKIEALQTPVGERFKSQWFSRLASGRPMISPAGMGVEETIERGLQRAGGLVDTRGLAAARIMHALAASFEETGRADYEGGLVIARSWGDDDLAGALEETRDWLRDLRGNDVDKRAYAQRALGTASLGSGGGLIAPQYATELLDYLHPMAVVRGLGVPSMPMVNGQFSQPYLDTAATASYTDENTGVNESSPGDKRLNLSRKILQGIIAISKELIRESSYNVTVFLRNHLGQVMAAREDLAFIRGDGTSSTPRGLKWWAGQATTNDEAHVFTRSLSANVPTVAKITADALKAKRLPEDAKTPVSKPGWIFRPREIYGLMAKRNATSELEVFPEVRGGTFYGDPYRKSVQIPQNLAGDADGNGTGNKSEAYFAHFGNLVVAEVENMETEVYDGGAYKDASGNVVSGITNREVVIAGAAGHDFGDFYRGKSCVVIESMDWGAPED